MKYIKEFRLLFFSYEWRINRSEYIFGAIFGYFVSFLFCALLLILRRHLENFFDIIQLTLLWNKIFIWFMGIFLYSLIVLKIKRFHDFNQRWWFMLIPIYWTIMPIFWSWTKGENGFWEKIYRKDKILKIEYILILLLIIFIII